MTCFWIESTSAIYTIRNDEDLSNYLANRRSQEETVHVVDYHGTELVTLDSLHSPVKTILFKDSTLPGKGNNNKLTFMSFEGNVNNEILRLINSCRSLKTLSFKPPQLLNGIKRTDLSRTIEEFRFHFEDNEVRVIGKRVEIILKNMNLTPGNLNSMDFVLKDAEYLRIDLNAISDTSSKQTVNQVLELYQHFDKTKELRLDDEKDTLHLIVDKSKIINETMKNLKILTIQIGHLYSARKLNDFQTQYMGTCNHIEIIKFSGAAYESESGEFCANNWILSVVTTEKVVKCQRKGSRLV